MDSSSSWDIDLVAIDDEDEGTEDEVEDGEDINQVEDPAPVPALAPPVIVHDTEFVLVPSFDSDAANDLGFPKVQPAAKDIVEHSFN